MLIGLGLGSMLWLPGAEAVTYTNTLTGNEVMDLANGYNVANVGGKLVYTFLNSDEIFKFEDRSASSSVSSNNITSMAIDLGWTYSNDFELNSTNQPIEIKVTAIGANSGGNTPENSAYVTGYGIYAGGTGNLTVGDSTTIRISTTAGSGTNNQANELNLSVGGQGVVSNTGNSTFGNDFRIFIDTAAGNGVSTDTSGSARSYVSSSLDGFTTNSKATFGDRLVISWSGQAGTINATKDSQVRADSHGVGMTLNGSVGDERLIIGDYANIAGISTGGTANNGGPVQAVGSAHGIVDRTDKSSQIIVGNDLSIDLYAYGGTASGTTWNRAYAETIGVMSGLIGTTGFASDLSIGDRAVISGRSYGGIATGSTNTLATATAIGIYLGKYTGITKIGADTKINLYAQGGTVTNSSGTTTDADAETYGIYSQAGTSPTFGGNIEIVTDSVAGTVNGVSGNAHNFSFFAGKDGNLLYDTQGAYTAKLTGDLGVSDTGLVNLTLDTPTSFLRGTTFEGSAPTSPTAGQGNVHLSLTNGARWQPTGDGSTINTYFGTTGDFVLNSGGIVDMAWWHGARNATPTLQYRTLNLEKGTLSNGGIFRVNSDVTNGLADQVISANIAGSGTQYIEVGYDPTGIAAAATTGILYAPSGLEPIVLNFQGSSFSGDVKGQMSVMDDPMSSYQVTPYIDWDPVTKIARIANLGFRSGGGSATSLTTTAGYDALKNHWKTEGNNMFRRVGDLRLSPNQNANGVWARIYGGSLEHKKYDQDYSGMQVGYDRKHEISGGVIHTGAFYSYLDSNPSYEFGSGKLYSHGISLYGSWISEKSHYVDVVLRASRLNSDHSLVDRSGNSVSSEYDTWAYGISAEYGYHKKLKNQWFVEPQFEVSLGRINSANHMASNGVRFEQSGLNTAQTRLGMLFGKDFTSGAEKNKGNAYLRMSWLHDFSGCGALNASYQGNNLNLPPYERNGDSLELNLGANISFSKKLNAYLELTKSFGGKTEIKWQANGGIRYNF